MRTQPHRDKGYFSMGCNAIRCDAIQLNWCNSRNYYSNRKYASEKEIQFRCWKEFSLFKTKINFSNISKSQLSQLNIYCNWNSFVIWMIMYVVQSEGFILNAAWECSYLRKKLNPISWKGTIVWIINAHFHSCKLIEFRSACVCVWKSMPFIDDSKWSSLSNLRFSVSCETLSCELQ